MYIDRAVIEVNGACNYSCNMCPQTDGRDVDFLTEMPLSTFKGLLLELRPNVVNLDGSGEATLTKELPKYIAAYNL